MSNKNESTRKGIGQMSEVGEVSIKSERTVHLADHELLLCFANDSGTEKFQDWWHTEGKESFDKYCLEGRGTV